VGAKHDKVSAVLVLDENPLKELMAGGGLQVHLFVSVIMM
jgi:hypothetical protein